MDYFNRAKRFRTKKRLGQNFLIDGDVINFIVNEANLTKEDTVIEIGSGIEKLLPLKWTNKLLKN